MVGWLTFGGRRRVSLEPAAVCGLTVLRAEVAPPRRRGEAALLRRAALGADRLAKAGCRRVLTAPDFPCWEALTARGLRPVDPEPLCQAMAGPLALGWLERRGAAPQSAVVALRGARVSRALFDAAVLLCPRVRLLAVSAPDGGEELRRFLREEFGAAALEAGVARADCTLLFSPEEGTPTGGVLRLHGPRPDLDGLALDAPEAALPGALEALPALSLLWEEGRLPTEKILVRAAGAGGNSLDSGGQTTYNI